MFIAALFTIAKIGNKPSVQQCKYREKCYIYIHTHMQYVYTHTHNGRLCNHEKEGNTAVCNNMTRDKLDTEKQILYDLTYKWNLKKLNL